MFQTPTPLLNAHQTLVTNQKNPRLNLKSFQSQNTHLFSPWTSLRMRVLTKLTRARSLTDLKRKNNLMRIWWNSLTIHLTPSKWLTPLTPLPPTSKVLTYLKTCHHPSKEATLTSPSRETTQPSKSTSQLHNSTSHLSNNSSKRDKCQPSPKWTSLLKWPDLQVVSSHSIRPTSTWTTLSHSFQRVSPSRRLGKATSSSQMVDGSAASAKTTTSKAERSATDARKLRPMMTAKVCHNIWLCHQLKEPRLKRRVSWRKWKLSAMLMPMSHARRNHAVPPKPPLLLPRKFRRESVTGLARDASTTTSPSETSATCAILATSRATKCSTANKAKGMSLFKTLTNIPNLSTCRCKLQWCNKHHLWAALPQHGPQSSVTIE